jgi:hypothetical protein
MKTLSTTFSVIVTVLLFFLSENFGFAQRLERNVPIIVNEMFQKKFPAKDPVWFSVYQGRFDQKLVYEARFVFDQRYSKAFYDNEGNLLAFAATVETSELPKAVLQYMKENYPTLPIAESLLVTLDNKEIQYEIGSYIDGEFVVFVFSKAGDFIKLTRA